MPRHYLVFVHGIGERETGKSAHKSHIEANYQLIKSYTTLWNHLSTAFSKSIGDKFENHFAPVYTDWHTEQIHRTENAIHNAAFPDLTEQKLSLIRPLRNFATFFMGDVIAYVSKDVNLIRRTVWQQMWDQLKQPLREEGATYSIIAHSLGTVVTFDYLYALLRLDELFVSELNPEMGISAEDRRLLRERFRHFFTLGSPIGLFMLREGKLWADCTPFNAVYNPVRGCGRSWTNFYDRKDVIAYPLQNIFAINANENQGCMLEDVPVWAGWTPFSAHTNYWKHPGVAARIVKTLRQTEPELAILPSENVAIALGTR